MASSSSYSVFSSAVAYFHHCWSRHHGQLFTSTVTASLLSLPSANRLANLTAAASLSIYLTLQDCARLITADGQWAHLAAGGAQGSKSNVNASGQTDSIGPQGHTDCFLPVRDLASFAGLPKWLPICMHVCAFIVVAVAVYRCSTEVRAPKGCCWSRRQRRRLLLT